MIAIHNLTYRYPDAPHAALDDVTLHIAEGDFVVIAGPSGCGKSTLALAIGGYLHHQFEGELCGTVRVGGLEVRDHSLFQVADMVGLVQQNPENQFCTLTVLDEVAFGLENRCLPPATIAALCDEVLDIVGAVHLAGRELATLSGGEKQKVAVASMLASRPRVLVFDEPTSNLDPSATRRIFEVLDAVRRRAGITIVVIEHKLDGLRPFGPRLIRMEGGRIVADEAALPSEAPLAARAPAPAGEPVARAEGLGVDYGAHTALAGVDATFAGGQLVALMGDNGSGKTTLLRCLMGLIPPSRGSITVLGHAIASPPARLSVSALARHAGFLFQNPDHQLLGDTVWDDATLLARNLGCLDAATPRVDALLDAAGLAQRRDDHPFRLSYGQKRRLNVIAATAHGPRFVLADEVLIGQDPANAARLMDRLRAMADDGACVILALHDPQVALRYADRLLFLSEGRIVADDAPDPALARLSAMGYAAYAALGHGADATRSDSAETAGPTANGRATGATHDHTSAPPPGPNRPRQGPDPGVAGGFGPATGGTSVLAPNPSTLGLNPSTLGLNPSTLGLHPLLKLAWLLAISAAAFVLGRPAQVVALLGMVLAVVALGGVDLRRVRFRGVIVWTALFLLLLQALFYRQGEPLLYLWPGGGGRWPVTAHGLGRGVRIAARFLVIVLSSQVFVLTTDPGVLAYALMRAGLPYRYGFALVTALRLVPIFRTEATTVYQAQLVRGVRYDAQGGARRLFALLRQFMLPLIVSALRKVDALAVSMEGRQFGRYPRRTYLRRAVWRRADWVGVAALAAFAFVVVLLAIVASG